MGRSHAVLMELVAPLAGKNGVVVGGGQGIGDILLYAEPVPAVLRLAVDGIAGDTEHGFLLLHDKAEVVPACASPGR